MPRSPEDHGSENTSLRKMVSTGSTLSRIMIKTSTTFFPITSRTKTEMLFKLSTFLITEIIESLGSSEGGLDSKLSLSFNTAEALHLDGESSSGLVCHSFSSKHSWNTLDSTTLLL